MCHIRNHKTFIKKKQKQEERKKSAGGNGMNNNRFSTLQQSPKHQFSI